MKLDVKKLDKFFNSVSRSAEMKAIVNWCVENFITTENGKLPNPQCLQILVDFDLTVEDKKLI